MALATYFLQECPRCSRRLQVRVCFLGRSVSCPHCETEFVASMLSEPESHDHDLMARADNLLAQSESVELRPTP